MMPFETKNAPKPLIGEVDIVGDKSISHRAIMLSAIAEGETRIHGLLEGEDVLATIKAFQNMGVTITKQGNVYHVKGVGLRGLKKPNQVLDMGNSGTSARLLMGILAGQDFETTITGDESLRKRPMKRVTEPLEMMGAKFEYLEQPDRLPIKITGNPKLNALSNYHMPMDSAQVKSAILLASVCTETDPIFKGGGISRNHTEIMLRWFGYPLLEEILNKSLIDANTHKIISDKQEGYFGFPNNQKLKAPDDIHIPRDPSAAAFFIAAALLVPDSELTLKNICMNPTRIGFLEIVKAMGGNINITNNDYTNGEPTADLIIKHSQLSGIKTPHDIAPRMIDEYPILSVLAAVCEGEIDMQGIGELRVKESDRIKAMQDGLQACGFEATSGEDWLKVSAPNLPIQGGATIKTYHDHRIAMSFIILGLITQKPIIIDDITPIATSFPTFIPLLEQLGVDFGK